MIRSRLISTDILLGLCAMLSRRRKWAIPPNPGVVVSCHREADDVLTGLPTPTEEVAAILFAFTRNEFRLEDAASDLPVAAAIAQARTSDIRVTDSQMAMMKDL